MFPHFGESDLWLARIDAAGAVTWTRSFGSPADDMFTHLVPLPDGAFLAVGWTSGTLTIGEGDPGATTISAPGDGAPIWFLARYTAGGTVTWVRSFRGVSWSTWFGAELDVAVSDTSGSILLVGSLDNDTTAAFGEGAGEVTLDPAGREAFVARYDDAGGFEWIETASGAGVGGNVATLAPDDGVFAAGWFTGIATFGRGQDQETAISDEAAPNESAWVARYDSDGALAWALPALGVYGRAGASRDATFLVGGSFADIALFAGDGPNATWFTTADEADDGFIARYDDGDFRCAVRLRGEPYGADDVSGVSIEQVVSRTDGGWDVVGTITGGMLLGEGTAAEIVVTAPTRDLFVATIDLVEP
jgi:hypothetical protein